MKNQPYFPKEEFEERWRRARVKMAENDLDALLAYGNPGNQFWLSGYLGYEEGDQYVAPAREAVLPKVLLPMEDTPALIGLEMTRASYRQDTYISDVYACVAPAAHHRPRQLSKAIEAKRLTKARIGIDLGGYQGVSAGEFQRLKNAAEDVEWVDGTTVFESLRIQKSSDEIDALRKAAAHQREALRQLSARAIFDGISGTERLAMSKEHWSGEGKSGGRLIFRRTHPAFTYLPRDWSAETREDQPVTWMDAGGVFQGYHANYSIIVSSTGAEFRIREIYEKLQDVYKEAVEHFQPGRSVRAIARKVRETVEDRNMSDPLESRFIGHSLGYEMIERPWLETKRSGDFVLPENMVIAPEWFVETSFGPLLYEENFVISETGLEPLLEFPIQDRLLSFDRTIQSVR